MEPQIEVTLIDHTHNAVDKLIYTKSTRLEQGEGTRKQIENMTDKEKDDELAYMANTIPSSWEFISYSFEIKNVTRAFTHQFVRTRTGSYAQQTMRMLEKTNFTYRTPPYLLAKDQEVNCSIYQHTMNIIQDSYDAMIADGVPAEDARGVLPTNIHTNIIAQFNLRTICEMAKSRVGTRTQNEYREVMEQMIEAVLAVHPWAEKFMFPVANKNFKMIESAIQDMAVGEKERYDLLKAVDKIRKGGT